MFDKFKQLTPAEEKTLMNMYKAPVHTKDSDCKIINEFLTCTVCGVYHGEQCPLCRGTGYHNYKCPIACEFNDMELKT